MIGVVISGLGAVTPLGNSAESLAAGLLAGRSGVVRMESTEFGAIPSRIAAPAEIGGLLRPEVARRLSRMQQLALIAADEAWQQSKLADVDPDRLAVVVGTGIGGVVEIPQQLALLAGPGARSVNPRLMPMLMPNAASATISIELGARAGTFTPVSACASGAEAIAHGLDLIRLNRADVVVAGGAESIIHPLTLAGFGQLRALSLRNDRPAEASRPFDRDRDGFVLGEGAGIVVLEREDHLLARGGTALARLLGAGASSDGHHMMAPHPEGIGAARCITTALRDAGVGPDDVGHVNCHATGTPLGDLAEARALHRALGVARPPVTANKSCTGHLVGASGAVEAVATVCALQSGQVPPTRNLDDVDPDIDLDVVRTEPRRVHGEVAMSMSFGFGGQNVTLVLAR